MADLRTEIREAFDKEQSAFPPPPALRHDAVDAVVARQKGGAVGGGGQPNFQWVAAAAAILITVAIVAGLMSIRLAQQPAPAHPSPPTSSPAPLADYGPPPVGVPLIYLAYLHRPGWLVGFDWSGKPRGTVKLAQQPDPLTGFSQAPDGSAFAYGFNGKGASTQFLDRLGQPIAGTGSHYQDQMWADDSRHICTLDGGLQWNLGILLPGESAPTTHVVAMDSNNLRSGLIAVSFAGCSARNDQAVIQYSYMQRPSEYWIFRISNGKLLAHRTFPADQLVNFVASPDGALIAENSAKSSGQIAPAAPSTIIRRVSDMSVVPTLDPTIGVLGFNGDHSMALVATTPWAPGLATQLAVIDVHSGAEKWRSDGTEELTAFLAQPDGKDFAIQLQSPSDTAQQVSVDLVIVHSDGTSTRIPGRYINL